MKPVLKADELFRGAMILTAAALITKILSALYRVPFQNIVGDVGFYIYQQVYPFYGMMLVLSTTGFPVIISKLYSDELKKGNQEKAIRLLSISLFFLALLGILLFFTFLFGAEMMAAWMGDPQLSRLFRVMAFPFLILPFTAVMRGYFQGRGNMIPTAYSQVGEQFVRVVTILALSFLLVKWEYSLYQAGSAAVFGSVTGGLVGLWILCFFFLRNSHHVFGSALKPKELASEAPAVFKALAFQGFAVSISGMVLILMQLADSLNLYQQLLHIMEAPEAKTAKGIFDRGQPLIQLGAVAATSIALSLVPAISGESRKGYVVKHVRIALQMSLLIGAAAAAGLFSIIEPTNVMLFQNADGSAVLAVLSVMILPATVLITLVGVLQGLNRLYFPAVLILTGFALKYGLNQYLVPLHGTMGAAVASLISLFSMMGVSIWKLRSAVGQRVLPALFIGKILFAAGSMGVFLHFYLELAAYLEFYLQPLRLVSAIQAVSAVFLGAAIYIIIVIRTKALGEAELLMLPFGSKLLFLLPNKTGEKI
ncbi:polysaccharide biosynthesis protein [Bacillus sp. FJAT-27251]|uniref:putative polysaccharide biosynthesis protein n=1 Tax=Bacillus sp. FJAT-27251 TaxID=1684142 RepID=UPI0006A7DA37|nr:polysaccharide biosynthesis protein [Bacillus sp. FJAT-27251]